MTPVLTKVEVSKLSDISEGDHIMTGTQHFLVASTDKKQNTYTGYTCEEGKVVKKVCAWEPNAYNICIRYEDSFSSREALENAEKEIEQFADGNTSEKERQVEQVADSNKLDTKWPDSDMFVTRMKTGWNLSFNDYCLFDGKNELSSTQITPEIAVDEGDHIVVKDKIGNYQHVLVLKHSHGNELIVMPDINFGEKYGTLDIENYTGTEVYRINYKQSLPVDVVFRRAMSKRGCEVLQACRGESSKFISWAKTGKEELVNVLQLHKK